jgi:hypothetical protein
MRSYPPPSSSHSVSPSSASTHPETATAGINVFSTCATPANIAPIWNIVTNTITAHIHTTQLTPARGPGIRLNEASPVFPVAIVNRPISD